MSNNKKIIVITGPTASGKSVLAIHLAKRYNGEIISADSRQIYKGLKIGSGAVTKKEMSGIPHHLIGIANPKKTFTVSDYKKLARKELGKIWKRNKLPIMVGGTGLYIRAVVDGLVIPEVKPNLKLRKELDNKTVAELSQTLKKMDLRRWKEIDRQNPRRLIRAIEIATILGKVPKLKTEPLEAETLFLGVKKEGKEFKSKVQRRVGEMIKAGLVTETQRLVKLGVPEKKMREFGFEYSSALDFIGGKMGSKFELSEKITKLTLDYAKRQMTWFKKDGRIQWVMSSKEALDSARKFLYY